MKLFSQIIFVIALAAIHLQAVITRPDEVLAKLEEAEANVFEHQAEIKISLTGIRTEVAEAVNENYNTTLTIITDNVKSVSVSDGTIRETLSAEPVGPCITNLNNFLDQIIEMSGYYISNCIIITDNATINLNDEFWSLLESHENEVNTFANIVITALVGRNIFTESEAIIARIEELVSNKLESFEGYVTDLKEKSAQVGESWSKEIVALEVCFADISSRINAAIGLIEAQLPACRSFNTRGSRSAVQLLNPISFFPPL